MQHITGKYFKRDSSKTYAARLSANSSGLTLSITGQDTLQVAWQQIKISSRLGRSARYIQLADLGRFESMDNDEIDAIVEQFVTKKPVLSVHRLESSLHWVAVGVALTIAFIYCMGRWGIPAAADYIVEQLPNRSGVYLETAILKQLEEQWFEESQLTADRQEQLHSLFLNVKNNIKAERIDTRLLIRDAENSVGANALAFPNGTIILTDQLVRLASNEQIAGVLAHELGHIEANHSLRQLVRGSMLTFLVAWISGDVSGASSAVIAAPIAFTELRYSRQFEIEADTFSTQYFACTGQDASVMADFFRKIAHASTHDNDHKHETAETNHEEETSRFLDFLSTHPSTQQRVKHFEHSTQTAKCLH